MKTVNRTAIEVRPLQPFLTWLKHVDPSSVGFTVKELQQDAALYLIPDFEDEDDVRKFLQKRCTEIFEDQLNGWFRDKSTWPNIRDFETFDRWFEWKTHSLLIDLCGGPVRRQNWSVPEWEPQGDDR